MHTSASQSLFRNTDGPSGNLEKVATHRVTPEIVTKPSWQSVSPDQPEKLESYRGLAISLTTVSAGNVVRQSLPHEIVDASGVTESRPLPRVVTVRTPSTVRLYSRLPVQPLASVAVIVTW